MPGTLDLDAWAPFPIHLEESCYFRRNGQSGYTNSREVHRNRKGSRIGLLALPHQPVHLEPCRLSSLQLFLNIGEKQHLIAEQANLSKDAAVGIGFPLATNVSVEIATEQRRQVTILGIPKDQLLGLYRAGGIDVKLQAVRVPAPQVLDSIWIDMALEVADRKSV